MRTQADYYALLNDLEQVEKAKHAEFGKSGSAVYSGRLYLTDEMVDMENVLERGDVVRGSAEFWNSMVAAAESAARDRASEYGFNIDDALGYRI